MNTLQNHAEADFSQVAPILDEAINELGEADRTAILLRFFEQHDFRTVGQALGSNEDAARMRVTRALEKLATLLKRRGVTAGSVTLGVALGTNAVQAAPAGLAITISTAAAALAGTGVAAAATTATVTATKAIAMTTTQKTIIGVTLAAAVGTGVYEAHQNSKLRAENQMLHQQQAPLRERQFPREASVSTNRAPATFDWRMVESADYRQYIANLRAIGCPEETIRDIIVADVNKLFESRRPALTTSTDKLKYWKTGRDFAASIFDPDRLEKEQALDKQRRELLKQLLGAAPEEKPNLLAAENDMLGVMLDFLSPSKQSEVADIFQKYVMKTQQRNSSHGAYYNDTEQEVNLRKEFEAELASVLTLQELEDFQLRMSPTAITMRSQLDGFDPTEQEFCDIFKLRKAYDDQFSWMERSNDKAVRDQAAAAKQEMNAQIKSLLGDARYAEYERVQDGIYQVMAAVAERNGLTPDAAVKVYDTKKLAEEAANRVRTDRSLTEEQRRAALRGIRAETEDSIRAIFGEQAFSALLEQNNGSYWLDIISSNP